MARIRAQNEEAAKPRDNRGRALSAREQLMAKITARRKRG
jgi:hypothetical protein